METTWKGIGYTHVLNNSHTRLRHLLRVVARDISFQHYDAKVMSAEYYKNCRVGIFRSLSGLVVAKFNIRVFWGATFDDSYISMEYLSKMCVYANGSNKAVRLESLVHDFGYWDTILLYKEGDYAK